MKSFSRLITVYLIFASCFDVTLTLIKNDYKYGKHLLNDIDFRVSAFEYPPFMMNRRGARGNATYSGAAADIVELMVQYFNMRIIYVPVDPVEVQKYGIGAALTRQLQKNEVDHAPFPFLQILEHSRQVDLCYPMTVEDFYLMQPFPNKVSKLSAPITPFSNEVWILFILSTIVFTIVMTVVIYTRNRASEERQQPILEQLYQRFEYVLTIVSSQGNVSPQEVMKKFVFRLMLALWLLSMVVLINAYIGTYTANMAVPKLESTVDTLEDLAASQKFQMTIELNHDLSYKVLGATSGPLKVLGDSFRKHPELLFTSPLDAMLNVAQKNCVYPGSQIIVNYYANADFKAAGECRITISPKPLLYFIPYSSVLQKESPYTETYNREFMLRVWENGVINRIRQKNFPPMPRRCQPWSQEKVENAPLKLEEFYGIFVLFLGGCISSILTFISELLIARLNKK